MSNPKPGGSFSLASYRAEAAKKGDKTGDFVLDVDEGKSIRIPRPTGDQMFEAESAMRASNSKAVLEALCGDQAGEVIDIFGAEDAAELRMFSEDLQKHFGIGE